MEIKFTPKPEKIIEAINYILHKHNYIRRIFILKALYYADKFHLQEYGQPLTGDLYYKLKHGPVGTLAYDLKFLCGFRPRPAGRLSATPRFGRMHILPKSRTPNPKGLCYCIA